MQTAYSRTPEGSASIPNQQVHQGGAVSRCSTDNARSHWLEVSGARTGAGAIWKPPARKMELSPSDEVARRQHRVTDHFTASPLVFTMMLKTAAFNFSVVATPGCPRGF